MSKIDSLNRPIATRYWLMQDFSDSQLQPPRMLEPILKGGEVSDSQHFFIVRRFKVMQRSVGRS
jgi:hypothetical protein